MNKSKQILDLYLLTHNLKHLLRQGWVTWQVSNVRIETVAEHVYGTLMLAVSIGAHTDAQVDMQKVALMLALHEMEEIIIGDLTFFDTEKRKTKAKDGEAAVKKLFENCKNKEMFISIIHEFEAKQTPEARFAYQCDKLEADIQAYLYRENFDYDKVSPTFWQDKRVQAWTDKGINKAEQMFLLNDKHLYSGAFLDIANHLAELQQINNAN